MESNCASIFVLNGEIMTQGHRHLAKSLNACGQGGTLGQFVEYLVILISSLVFKLQVLA